MKRRVLVSLFMLVTVTVVASFVSSNDIIVKVKADPEAILAVYPPLSAPRNPGEIVTILVNVTGVSDLFTWAFRLNWTLGLLQCTSATEETSFFDGEFNSIIGANYVDMGSSLTPPATGSTGSGRLARLRFTVTDTGQTTFGLLQTSMYNSTGGEISHLTETGIFYTTWPKARFTMSPDPRINSSDYGRPIAGEPVTFNATTSFDPDDPYESTPGGITSYEWDFDYDGVSFDVEATGATASNAYEDEGTYFPSLRVTDDDGDTDIHTYPLEGLDVFYHDLAIIDVTLVNDPPEVGAGAAVYVNATVLNRGSETQYLNVTLYAWAGSTAYPVNTTVFEWIYIDAWGAHIPRYTLTAGQNETTTIKWDTTGFPAGEYYLGVEAFMVTPPTHPTPRIALPGLEPNLQDNEWADGLLTITGVTEHAIELTSVAVSPTDLEFDEWADVETTITNAGNVNEHLNLTVTVYYDSVVFKTEAWTNATIIAGGTRVFDFPLLKADDTADEGTYNVTASVYLVYPTNLTEIQDGTTNDTLSALFQIQIYPVVDFTYSPTSPVVGQEVLFDASDSYAPGANGGTIEIYQWDFGDGTLIEVTTPTTTHVYRWTATFTVTLEVTDDVGLESTLTRTGLQGVKVSGTHDLTITTVSFSPNKVTTGDTIEISVTIENTGSFPETFNVTTYYAETAISTQTNVTLTVDADTTLTFQWSTAGVIGGDYAIKAYASNVTGETHVDDNVRIGGTATVAKFSSDVTASATPASITIGDMVTIDGAVSPGAAGIEVKIWYMQSGGTWSELATVATLTDGTYTYLWTPSEAGSYAVMASWAGDALTLPSESAPLVVTVQEAPAPEIYLYTTGALAVVLVATIVYFVWLRKPKPT